MANRRSPSYPGTDLAAALEDARALYQQEGRSPFALEAGAKALRYRGLSGPARKRLSALRQYGLLVQKRGGEARLSERALTLVLGRPSSREHQGALREAALEPPLFRELAETRAHLSDDSLRHVLIVERGFTDSGATEFANAFRQTMALAGIIAEADAGHDEGFIGGALRAGGAPPGRASPPIQRERVPLRLPEGLTAVVELPHPMSKQAWRQMMAILEALKPGYVVEEDATPPPGLP